MIKKIFTIVLILCGFHINAHGQIQLSENLILEQGLSSQSYDYKAMQSITLQPGFSYKASGNYNLKASIDHLNLQPNPYPNNILGGSDKGIVGKIDDNFDITPSGQVSYEIPIKVPAGTGGITPLLSVVYNSASREGLLGAGFDLAGLSMVSRAPSNLHTDGKVGCVDFSNTDKFVLDGQRLIYLKSISATTYEYRTERNSFSKIIASGNDIANGNPDLYTVHTKDGLIYEYGSNNSQLKSQGNNSSLFWLLRKVSDTKGNYYTIAYGRDDANGEYWPTRIDYTGNDNAGLSPYNSVRFEYDTSLYPSTFYISGMRIQKSKRIKSLNIHYGEEKIKSYEFAYIKSLETFLLSSVTEKAADGKIINPTDFSWNNKLLDQDLHCDTSNGSSIVALGNFQGTGFRDGYLTVKQDLFDEKYSKITGIPGKFQSKIIKKLYVGDFNNDGYDDVILKTTTFTLYLNRKGSHGTRNLIFEKASEISIRDLQNYYDPDQDIKIGDFNGDGISDIILFTRGKGSRDRYHLFYGSKDGTFTNENRYSVKLDSPDVLEIVDFNGDGMSDIININTNGCMIYEATGDIKIPFTKRTFDKTAGPHKLSSDNLHFGDFNGDGKTDIMSIGKKNSDKNCSTKIYYSTGKSFSPKTPSITIPNDFPNASTWELHIADINGDGRDDFFAVANRNSDAIIYRYINLSDGSKFSQGLFHSAPDGATSKCEYYIVDNKNQGRPQLLSVAKNEHKVTTETGRYSYAHYHKLYSIQNGGTNLLSTIMDGSGSFVEISYRLMNSRKEISGGRDAIYDYIHEKGTTETYPLISFNSSCPLVEKISHFNGIDERFVTSYKYKNALLHKRGRGVLGFEYFIVKDETNNIETTTQFEVNTEQYVTAVKSVETRVNGKLLNKVENTNKLKYYKTSVVLNKIFTYDLINSKEYKYEINANKLYSTIESAYEYDDYGNVTKSSMKYGNSDIISNTNIYSNNENKWHLGRLTKATVTKSNGKETITKISQFEYDPSSGILNKEIVEPNDSKLGYTKTYEHDVFGNIIKNVTRPNDIKTKARTKESKYNTNGRFEIEAIDNIDNKKWGLKREINHNLGAVLSETDANGIKSEYMYDSFGQLIFTKNPLGNTQSVLRWSDGHSDAPKSAKFFKYSEKSGSVSTIEFFDVLGRSLRSVVTGFDGRKIYTDVVYNAKGQIEKTSEPYFVGQTIYWNKSEYDEIGRVTKQIYTDNTYTSFQYDGLTTTTISPLGHKDTKVVDAQARLIKSIDNIGGEMKYEYDISGNCTKVISPRTVVETIYDKFGNRIKLIDPDLGIIEYGYNVYGELVLQKDTHGAKIFDYDELGRIKKETNNDGITIYSYDSQKKGLIDKIIFDNNNITKSFKYDSYGRTISSTESIDSKTYTTQTSYDIYSRVDKITYPSGFNIQHEYNSNGYLVKVKNPQENKIFWQAKTVNAKGQMEQFTLGNNLTTTIKYNAAKGYITDMTTASIQNWSYKFNIVGNLTDRIDNTRNLIEHFDYDGLNRLTKVSYNGQQKQVMTYDAAGNITSKTGIGTKFEYESGTNRLVSVSGGGYAPPTWDIIEYTSFNKLSFVSQGNNKLALVYGIDKERRKLATIKDGITEIKYYSGSLYEEHYLDGGEVKKVHYIFANGGAIAIYEQSSAKADKLCYIHKDHLGSIQAYSDENGKLAGEMSYDAWGRRRNPDNWNYYSSLTDAKVWNPRGFTGHEHLDIFEMINMNGRMYDPMLGRFLSPDPFVQVPDYTQGLNRYAYCVNNPLSLVDPSGYSWFSKNYKSLFATGFGVVVAMIPGGQGPGAAIIAGALGGAASGFAYAVFNGSNMSGIASSSIVNGVWGGVGGIASYGAGSIGKQGLWVKLTAHSSSQALLEGAKGGSLKHGFISGLASSAGGSAILKYGGSWGVAGKVAANAALSGTVAELGGGKFANGAITGAYAMLFNDLMHEKQKRKATPKAVRNFVNGLLVGKEIESSADLSPVALTKTIEVDGEWYGAVKIAGGGGIILRGKDKGTIFAIADPGLGSGGIGFSAGVNGTMYFYTGDIDNFTLETLHGLTANINISMDVQLSINIGVCYSKDRFGEYTIGITGGVGYGLSAFGLNGYMILSTTGVVDLFTMPNME